MLNCTRQTCDSTCSSCSAYLLEIHIKEYMRSYIWEIADLDIVCGFVFVYSIIKLFFVMESALFISSRFLMKSAQQKLVHN